MKKELRIEEVALVHCLMLDIFLGNGMDGQSVYEKKPFYIDFDVPSACVGIFQDFVGKIANQEESRKVLHWVDCVLAKDLLKIHADCCYKDDSDTIPNLLPGKLEEAYRRTYFCLTDSYEKALSQLVHKKYGIPVGTVKYLFSFGEFNPERSPKEILYLPHKGQWQVCLIPEFK